MKTAGIREARQNLSSLIREVQKGREVLLTDRGTPVALLVSPRLRSTRPLSRHAALRASIRLRPGAPPLSQAIGKNREDRL